MSENTEHTADAGDEEQSNTEQETTTFSQEDVNRIVSERLERERKRFDGFDDYKAKAEQFDELQTSNNELNTQVEDLSGKLEMRDLTKEIAKEHGVNEDALRGNSREELESHAEVLKDLVKPTGPVIPSQAKTPRKVEDSEELRVARSLFGN